MLTSLGVGFYSYMTVRCLAIPGNVDDKVIAYVFYAKIQTIFAV